MGVPPVSLVLVSAVVVLLARLLTNTMVHLFWKPIAITKLFKGQGIRGPSYRFFVGSMLEIKHMKAAVDEITLDAHSHDFIPVVLPQHNKWAIDYGKTFLYWLGAIPAISLGKVDLVKQVLLERTGLFPKNYMNANLEALLGKGLILSNGQDWERHRKVVHPAFNREKLEAMSVVMAECVESMAQRWQSLIDEAGNNQVEIELSRELSELTSAVIIHSAFGGSHNEGREVFLAQKELQELAFSSSLDVPALGFLRKLPIIKENSRVSQLVMKSRSTLMQIIEGRLANIGTETGYGNDLLGLMLEARAVEKKGNGLILSTQEIIDECKTFFFAGQDTTSNHLIWTMFLLSSNAQWQEKLREEVLTVCGDVTPTPDMVCKLKLVNMVLLESLRLYSPVVIIRRISGSDIDLGNLKIPKGTVLSIPIAMIHRDKDVWGPDANEFNPSRFENGVSKAANYPNALLSFSQGPRACIGQTFAMQESQIAIAMILQRFKFRLSPRYVHAPMEAITLRPKFGLPIMLTNLHG
uniref:Cytochrome P450 n=1 Tax=Leersia perrieri TaxID=77586 RepID=A0A0D9V0N8_9ORYZ